MVNWIIFAIALSGFFLVFWLTGRNFERIQEAQRLEMSITTDVAFVRYVFFMGVVWGFLGTIFLIIAITRLFAAL